MHIVIENQDDMRQFFHTFGIKVKKKEKKNKKKQ